MLRSQPEAGETSLLWVGRQSQPQTQGNAQFCEFYDDPRWSEISSKKVVPSFLGEYEGSLMAISQIEEE